MIVFSPGTESGVEMAGLIAEGSLYQVSAGGGQARPATTMANSPKERAHLHPFFLPDDRHFLYLATEGLGSGEPRVKVGSLDSPDSRALAIVGSKVAYAPPGYLVYSVGDSLVAQSFDLAKLEVTGDPVPIAETISRYFWYVDFSVSENGDLAYRAGSSGTRLVRRDYSGAETGQVGEMGDYVQVDLSDDEKRIGLGRLGDVWFYETANQVLSRFTYQGGVDLVWSPDNQRAVFASARAGNSDLYLKSLGGGEAQILLDAEEDRYPETWSSDGRYIVCISVQGKSVYAIDMSDRQKEPKLLLQTPFETDEFQFSPNGKWLAYNSTESGKWEVYVASFPDLAHKRQVSNAGGVQPVWSTDGEKLFYLDRSGRVMSVKVTWGSVLETSAPQELFQTGIAVNPVWNQYDVSKDDQFLLIEPVSSGQISVVLNWPEELENPL
jgi:WD40 repeat protein